MIVEFSQLFKPIITTLLGYVLWRFKKMDSKIDKTLDETEIRQLIEDKSEPVKVLQKEIKEDLNRIEKKMDKLNDILMER